MHISSPLHALGSISNVIWMFISHLSHCFMARCLYMEHWSFNYSSMFLVSRRIIVDSSEVHAKVKVAIFVMLSRIMFQKNTLPRGFTRTLFKSSHWQEGWHLFFMIYFESRTLDSTLSKFCRGRNSSWIGHGDFTISPPPFRESIKLEKMIGLDWS